MLSGDFSAEIRLGYKIENGVKTSFKGGLFTGNIFKLMEDIELSKEIFQEENYLGPKAIKFHKAEIVGM
jgi:predicted Zn-dependent protease